MKGATLEPVGFSLQSLHLHDLDLEVVIKKQKKDIEDMMLDKQNKITKLINSGRVVELKGAVNEVSKMVEIKKEIIILYEMVTLQNENIIYAMKVKEDQAQNK